MYRKKKLFVEVKLSNEIEYFEKKYTFKINIIAKTTLIIPEYKIELLNKSKKIINTVENITKLNINGFIQEKKFLKSKNIEDKINLKKTKKTKQLKKKITKPRTLWVRRKKKI